LTLFREDRFDTGRFEHFPAALIRSDFDHCHGKLDFCSFLRKSLHVHVNMIQSRNGQLQSKADQPPKPKAKYSGERLLPERPRVYRKVVELLAEPREQMSIRKICRRCHVTDDTVKAVEKREAVPIAARKETLLSIAANAAQLSAERMGELAPAATLRDASVSFGIATEKMLLLSGDPTLRIEHTIEPGPNLYERLARLHNKLTHEPKTIQATIIEPLTAQSALPSHEAMSDSGAGNGLEPEKRLNKTSPLIAR
jgi:hypothetical protein